MIHKKHLDNERLRIQNEQESGIDVDHSLHHGGTAWERAKKHASMAVLKGLDDCFGADYPSSIELQQIQNIMHNR